MKKIFLSGVLLLLMGFTFAHQPRLVFDMPAGQVVNIQKPEVSQAFYGILSGQKDIYKIASDTGFLLSINLVVPDISGSRTDFSVDVQEGDAAVYTRLDGTKFQWTNFFEPFAGDIYLQWPSLERQVSPWTYTISVSSPDNQGKYSLVIGKLESFPLNETIHTYKVLPELKMVFFDKPWYTAFWNIVGWFLLGTIIVLVVLIWGIVKIIKYIRDR